MINNFFMCVIPPYFIRRNREQDYDFIFVLTLICIPIVKLSPEIQLNLANDHKMCRELDEKAKRMTQFECEAILFDLDGTLVDSTASVERSWRLWTDRAGLDFDEVMAIAHGRPAAESLRIVAPDLSVAEEAAWLEDQEAADAHTVEVIEGAQSLLASLPENRWCIVTSGTDRLARARIFHGGLSLPNVLITADDVINGKPDPEPYLIGAQRMNLTPSACVVLEDSAAGVASAKAAGMRVIAVTTTHSLDALQAADLIIDSLLDLQVNVPANGAGTLKVGV